MGKTHERVRFRMYGMECCGHQLCWANPRPPTFCSVCGRRVFPEVNGWALFADDEALLTLERG